jgi:hypothetical protein
MKFSFQFLLLAYAASYPVLVLAELAGARLPAIVSHANALGFFVAIMIGLLLTVEYGRPRRALRPLRRRRRRDGALARDGGRSHIRTTHAPPDVSDLRDRPRPVCPAVRSR